MFRPARWTLSALGLLAAGVPAAAQRDAPSAMAWSDDDRPRIGVVLHGRSDAESDRYGARVEQVTPDGPADQAGLKAGDIITRFNGVALGGIKAEDPDDSGPSGRLAELVGKLQVGDSVDVEYRRDGQARKTRLAPTRAREVVRHFEFRMPGMPPMPPMPPGVHGEGSGMMRFETGPDGARRFLMLAREGTGVELADMNEGLSGYFGTSEGALVLETPADSTSPLKAGDVVLAIDGRSVSSAAHARRILASYDSGERASIEVMRKQKKTTLTWTFAERPARRARHAKSPRAPA